MSNIPQTASPGGANASDKDRLGAVLQEVARLFVLASLFVLVWAIGGYFPVPRFISLTFLTTAIVFVVFGGLYSGKQLRSAIPLLIVALAYIVYGLLQLVPDSSIGILDWTGVREIQNQYGASDAALPLSQSIVSWMTQDWLAMATIAVLAYFLSATLFNDDRSRLVLLSCIAICGVGQVMWAVIQVSAYPDKIFWGVDNPFDGGAPFGTFLNRNHAADFIGMALACSIGLARWRFASDTHKWHAGYGVTSQLRAIISNPVSLTIWLCIFTLVFGLILSLSRGGWASAVIAIVLVPLCWKKAKGKRNLPLLAGSVLSLFVVYFSIQFFGFGDRIDARLDDLEVENMLTDPRFDHWSEVLPAAQHFLPFGSGVGTYGYAYLAFDPEPERGWFTHAHNQYLETFVEAGIPGILLVIVGVFLAIRAGVSLCASDRSVTKQALGITALGAVILQVFHAFTDFGLMMPGNLITFALILGAATAATAKNRKRSRKRRSRTRKTQPKLAGSQATSEQQEEETQSVPVKLKSAWPQESIDRFVAFGLSTAVLVAGCLALWQQGRMVSAEKVLAKTTFTPSTPSPTVTSSEERIAELRHELEKWPEYEPLMRRMIQLQLHAAQRATFDEIRASQGSIDPLSAWDGASLESVVIRLHDDSDTALSEDEQAGLVKAVAAEPHLSAAWDDIRVSLAHNPVQPRTHLRMAQLAAATGRQWRDPFERSKHLSVIDPKQSLGNGLLAWAAGDRESMVQQWSRSLSTDWAPVEVIHKLASSLMTNEEMARELMPDRWVVPFRLSQRLREQGKDEDFRLALLDRANEIAKKTLNDISVRERTLGIISSAKGDPVAAVGHYEKAIESNPKDAELRHLAAVALYQSGQTKQAVAHARVATLLSPKNPKFRVSHQRFLRIHRRQYTQKVDTSNEPSRPQPN